MDTAAIYAAGRQRLLDLAPTLSADQAAAPLAPTPPWTVVDGYRHLAGGCANVLDGEMANAASPDWTAAQLAARADRTLEEVAAEWAERGPDLDVKIAEGGPAIGFLALDLWTHEQDIRIATGVGSLRDDPLLPPLVDLALSTFGPYYTGKGGPPVRLAVDGADLQLGEGEPEIELRTSAYELMRMIFGRRSSAQIAGAAWSGDHSTVEEALAAIHVFDCPPHDLVD